MKELFENKATFVSVTEGVCGEEIDFIVVVNHGDYLKAAQIIRKVRKDFYNNDEWSLLSDMVCDRLSEAEIEYFMQDFDIISDDDSSY